MKYNLLETSVPSPLERVRVRTIIQITSGKGPIECEFFVGETFSKMQKEMQEKNVRYKILEMIEGLEIGFQSITMEIENAENFMENWKGSILYVSKSKFRPNHRRKNWYIGVFEVENFHEIHLDENEIEFQTMRSSGNGGQNVNKVNSAVRAIHKPTKFAVVAMDSRSQHENKKLAVERLKLKILEKNAKEKSGQKINQWMNHLQLERGNPKRIFKVG